MRKTIIFVTHDIDEAIFLGDRIAILREGGVLAQYDTPEELLAHPADEFVARFVGADRGLKRLSLKTLGSRARARGRRRAPTATPDTTLRDALSLMLSGAREHWSSSTRGRAAARRPDPRPAQRAVELTAAGPVIPDFGEGSACVTENRLFCTDWVRDNWSDVLQPALVQHIVLTVFAVTVGLAISLRGRAAHASLPAGRAAVRRLLGDRLHDPEPRALPAARAGDRADGDDRRGRARRLHAADPLPERARGLRGVPPDVLEAARGMGLHAAADAVPGRAAARVARHDAGLRVAVVSTIALATVAALVIPQGLGYPIFLALREYFKTEIIAAGALAIGLALVGGRAARARRAALTPWARARRTA